MNKEHSRYLVENFPKLYQGYGGDPRETLMAFGFECGDGWFDLLKELSEKIENHDVVASQVKEKYGTLRFYLMGGATDEVWDLIDEAEEESGKICEECGQPGKLIDGGWLSVRCEACGD